MIGRLVVAALVLVLACPAADAGGGRRAVRVDSGGWFNTILEDCVGGSSASLLLQRNGFLFAGPPLFEQVPESSYCQISGPSALAADSYFNADEPGILSLLAEQQYAPGCQPFVDCYSHVVGLRYTYRDNNQSIGFQWGMFFFPRHLVLVSLYGVQNVVLDAGTRIVRQADSTVVWNATGNIYNGEYFCFDARGWAESTDTWRFLGSWDGELTSLDQACEGALRRVFEASFEG